MQFFIALIVLGFMALFVLMSLPVFRDEWFLSSDKSDLYQ